MYLGILDDLGKNDKVYYSVITKIKKGLQQNFNQLASKELEAQSKKETDGKLEMSTLKQKNDNYERVIKEMKKQL
jgi:hypothetical protein